MLEWENFYFWAFLSLLERQEAREMGNGLETTSGRTQGHWTRVWYGMMTRGHWTCVWYGMMTSGHWTCVWYGMMTSGHWICVWYGMKTSGHWICVWYGMKTRGHWTRVWYGMMTRGHWLDLCLVWDANVASVLWLLPRFDIIMYECIYPSDSNRYTKTQGDSCEYKPYAVETA